MDECLNYLEAKCKKNKDFKFEIIIVSDGSKDNTVGCAMTYTMKYTSEKIRVLALTKNRGKGGAVRLVDKKKITTKFIISYQIIFYRACKVHVENICSLLMLTV